MAQRLTDLDHLVSPDRLAAMERKLAECITRMLAAKNLGGNPFLFTMVATKAHKLTLGWPESELSTAATDGVYYYWNPEFLEKLTPAMLRIVVEHEAYHNVFFHTLRERILCRDPKIWNIAVDYVSNTVIAVDRLGSTMLASGTEAYNAATSNVFGGQAGLGDAMPLAELLDSIVHPTISTKRHIFADRSHGNKSAEWFYDEIMKVINTLPQCPGCGKPAHCSPSGQGKATGKASGQGAATGQSCSGPGDRPSTIDSHIPSKQSREEAIWEVMKAADTARAMGRGTLPSGVEDFITELGRPTLRPSDIIKMAIQKVSSNTGVNKDFKRFRRRGISLRPHAEYVPRYLDVKPKWIAMLDTSGSHDMAHMKNGVAELKLAGGEGLIVPCDAMPYWDKATKVTNIDDLVNVNASGRGGTVFNQFFRELPYKAPGHHDVVVIITDCECGHVPLELRPPCDVLWLCTNDKIKYTPTFGRVIYLKG